MNTIFNELILADIMMKPEEFCIIWIVLTFVPAGLAALFQLGLMPSATLAVIGAVLPVVFIKVKKDKRKKAFEAQNKQYNDDIIDLFAQKNLVSNSAFCKLFAKFRHYDEDRFGNPLSYPAGTYYLSTDMGVEGMLSEILSAGSKDSTVMLTFPEGYTIDQIIEKLSKNDPKVL